MARRCLFKNIFDYPYISFKGLPQIDSRKFTVPPFIEFVEGAEPCQFYVPRWFGCICKHIVPLVRRRFSQLESFFQYVLLRILEILKKLF